MKMSGPALVNAFPAPSSSAALCHGPLAGAGGGLAVGISSSHASSSSSSSSAAGGLFCAPGAPGTGHGLLTAIEFVGPRPSPSTNTSALYFAVADAQLARADRYGRHKTLTPGAGKNRRVDRASLGGESASSHGSKKRSLSGEAPPQDSADGPDAALATCTAELRKRGIRSLGDALESMKRSAGRLGAAELAEHRALIRRLQTQLFSPSQQ